MNDGGVEPLQDEELEEVLASLGDLMSVEDWQRARELGRGEPVEDLLARFSTRGGGNGSLGIAYVPGSFRIVGREG